MASNQGTPSTSDNGPTRLRQIALVAQDLEKARHLLTTVIGTEVVYVDPLVGQWGLENFLIAIGGEIIEVVSPTRPSTTAGRLLDKRGDGGYMLIMQNLDAAKRKRHIEARGLAKPIWTHETPDSTAVQYHPKGIKGGVIAELDSHAPSPGNPTPLQTRFSPWHACGPATRIPTYTAQMQAHGHLSLVGALLQLRVGEGDGETAARDWEEIFGVARARDSLAFTNARVGIVRGREGEREGLVSVTVGVRGRERLKGVLERAGREGVVGAGGEVVMVGVRWFFVLTGEEEKGEASKL